MLKKPRDSHQPIGASLLTVGIVLGLLYMQLLQWQHPAIGPLVFLSYILLTAHWWRVVLHRVFGYRCESALTWVFALFFVFLLLAFGTAIFVVWYHVTPFILFGVCASVGIGSAIFGYLTSTTKPLRIQPHGRLRTWKYPVFPFEKIGTYTSVALLLVAYFLLFKSQSSDVLLSPWQTIDSWVLPIFFVVSISTGILIFSRQSTKKVLLLLIGVALLTHAYLPFSHTEPWGGDVWRHIASEAQLKEGKSIPPVLFGGEARWREVAGVDIPEALLIPNKYLYGQYWSAHILMSEILALDLSTTHRWLLPIIWSIMLPLILFRLGKTLFGSWRIGLLLVWLSHLFFALQVTGAIAMPNTLGLLTFLFAFMFFVEFLQQQHNPQRGILLVLGIIMVFGYTLYTVLFFVLCVITYLLKKLSNVKADKIFNFQFSILKKICVTILALISICTFPLIELISKRSILSNMIHISENAKQAVGQFSGWFFASQIRPHDIVSGNILFNHTPDYAFVSSLFSDFRWHVMLISGVVCVMVLFGLYQLLAKEKKIVWHMQGILFAMVVGGYGIGWYVLEGERLFVRRLDPLFGITILLLAVYGYRAFQFRRDHWLTKVSALCFVAVLSWFGTTAFASGPDIRVVSDGEVRAASLVSEYVTQFDSLPCVFGDTWPLLILEAKSKGVIVGGGFPVDAQFGQTKRVELFEELIHNSSENTLTNAKQVTGAMRCQAILPIEVIEKKNMKEITELFGTDPEQFGDVLVWGVT